MIAAHTGKSLARPCPICSCRIGQAVHHQEFAAPAELAAPDAYDVVACPRCGFVFADYFIDQAELDRSYQDHSKYAVNLIEDGIDESALPPPEPPYDLDRMRAAASYLARRIPSRGARILDAGCATGALLAFLQEEGFTNVMGLDPSLDAVAVARRAHGVRAVGGSFMFPPAGLATFDVVILSHTLEHLPFVATAIERLRELLVPGGLAYVEVPDASRYADYLVSPFHDFNTEHVNHFSLPVLRYAMQSGGFTEVDAGSKLVECGPRIPYPAIYGVWRNEPTGRETFAAPDSELLEATRRYVDDSTALMARISNALTDDIGVDQDVAIWGAGQLAMKLLRDTVLAERKVVSIIDASPQRLGLHFGDLEVKSPETLREMPEVPIVIASIHSEDSIVRMIRDQFALSNRVVRLRAPALWGESGSSCPE